MLTFFARNYIDPVLLPPENRPWRENRTRRCRCCWLFVFARLKDNSFDLNETPMTLGPVLQMDAKSETFTDNDAANAMLTRKYRKDFEVSWAES